ncbi:MAG TPA: hypothetical protein VH158_09330 [Gemmatimonadales bacterium]|jgi:hypothetical protein|nr:hypothetical protein [Gemmatimonadales bacterium]
MTRGLTSLLAALGAAACGAAPPPVHLEPGPPLALAAAPGVRINARLKPALELADGTVLRFDSPHLTPDSAYFAAAPTVTPPAGARRGTLRLSVCLPRERICRLLALPVTW